MTPDQVDAMALDLSRNYMRGLKRLLEDNTPDPKAQTAEDLVKRAVSGIALLQCLQMWARVCEPLVRLSMDRMGCTPEMQMQIFSGVGKQVDKAAVELGSLI